MIESPLNQVPSLGALVDEALIAELGRRFADVHRIGLRILDSKGMAITQLSGRQSAWDFLWDIPACRGPLTQFIQEIKAVRLRGSDVCVLHEPIANMAFMGVSIEYEFEKMGTIILGPFRLRDNEPRLNADTDYSLDLNALNSHLEPLACFGEDELTRLVGVLSKSLEINCHLGYRTMLTSQMHVDSMAEAYRKLESANAELEARNAALAANVARLRELDVLKSNFLATVSHELRTPLTSVIGYSEMLLEGLAGPMNDEQREYVSTIMGRGESLLSLIGNILDISRIQRGGVSLNLEYANLEDLVEGAMATVRPQAYKQSIELRVEFEPQLPDIQVDEQKIHQVLVNLLGNAVKFTGMAGRVSLRVRRCMVPSGGSPKRQAAPGIEIEVTDTGIGIPPDKMSRIFDAFYQVDNSATRRFGGAGLGLSIVRNVVQAHGGRIRVKSKVGEGAQFIVTLPVEQAIGADQPS